MIKPFTSAWLYIVTHHPKAVLGVIVVVLLAAIIGLPNFKLDASADSLTLEHDPDLDFFRDVSRNYDNGDFLVVSFTPKDQDLFSDDSLDTLSRLQQDLAGIQGVESINSILNVPLLYSPKQSLREIASNPRTLLSEAVDRQQAKQEFLTSPIYRELILSPEGQTTALQLNMAVDYRYLDLVKERDTLRAKDREGGLSRAEKAQLHKVSEEFLAYRTNAQQRNHEQVEAVREVVAQYQSEAEIFVGGVSMITADMITFIKKDLVLFGCGVVLFMILVLTVIFRSLRFVVLPMATCLTALVMMLGLLSWLDWRLTVISSNFVALLLIISLSIIIHLVVRYREHAELNPDWSQLQLVERTLTEMAKPCLYTTLTTVVAFASLVVSDIRPVIDFGWMMTIGLILAFALAFMLMPAALMLLPRDKPKADRTSDTGRGPLTGYCAIAVERAGPVIVIVSLIGALLGVWGVTKLQVENRFIDYFHEDTEIHQGLLVIDNKLGGTTSLDIIIARQAVDEGAHAGGGSAEQGSGDAEDDPFADMAEAEQSFEDEFAFDESQFDDLSAVEDSAQTPYWLTLGGLREINEIHDYLDSQPEIGKVQSLSTLYKVGQDINGSLNDFELAVLNKSLTPATREVLIDPFVFGEDQTRITMRVIDSYPGLERFELVERIRNHLDTELNLDMEQVRFTGLLVLYNNMLKSLFNSQIVTIGAVFLAIMAMFIVLFRSFTVATIAIAPNLLAALCIVGGMGLVGIPLDMMTITVAAITVGIGVDNTIHYVHRFKAEIAKDGDYMAAMHRAHRSIGRAMYYTSIIIIFGFSIMVFSQFIPTIYFGVLTGFAMLVALAGALLLLPKIILWVRPFKAPARPAADA